MASVELSKMGGTDVPPAGPADDAHAVTIKDENAEESEDDVSKMSTMWLGICFAGIMGTLRAAAH